MLIIPKYITREISRYFFLVLLTVVSIYLVVDFFERIDNFISSHLGVVKAGAYFLYNLPMIVSQILPICLLLSVLIALGLMNKHNEITAMKSGGISHTLIYKPVLTLGFGFTLILFVLSEIVVPLTVPKSNRIWLEDVKKKQIVASREKNIWMKGDGSITHIKFYDSKKKTIYGLSAYYFDKQFSLVKRVDAEKGVFADGYWHLYNIMEQDRVGEDHNYKTRVYDEQQETLQLTPEDLQQVRTKSEEMSIVELYGYIRKVEAEGYDALNYRVDFYAKTAFPFVCIVMCLLGAGIAVRRNMREGLPVGIAYGLGIAFLYWIFYNFCLSLGYGGLIPPFISAWLANLFFLCWGIFVILSPE